MSASPTFFVPIAPQRILDTRTPTAQFGGTLAANETRALPILSNAPGVPANVAAYSFNLTVLPAGGKPLIWAGIWPAGQPQPNVSTINAPSGSVLANAAIVPAGTDGAVNVFASNPTDILLDLNGYFIPVPIQATLTRAVEYESPYGTLGVADGENRIYTLANDPALPPDVLVDGVKQRAGGDYTLSGRTVTFGEAPDQGIYVEADYFHA